MDLRRLEYFLAVVEYGSVTVAASALHIAQPSLSQSIRALERDLGVTLFDRSRGRLSPTAQAEALLEPARRTLQDLAAARTAVREAREPGAGRLQLAVHDPLAVDLADDLAAFCRAHPEVPVRVIAPRDEDEIVRLLVEGRCELGVTYLPLRHPGLRVRRLGTQHVRIAMPPDCAGRPDPLPLRDLAGMPLVDSVKGFTPARAAIRAALLRERVVLRPAVRSAHREAIVPLVVAGAGVAFMSERYGREAVRQGAVVRRIDPSVEVDYGVLYRAGALSAPARHLLQQLAR